MSTILMDAYRYVPPLASNFPTLYGTNSENPTLTDTTGRGLVFDFGVSPTTTGFNVRGAMKTKPVSTTYDIILRAHTNMGNPYTFASCGIAFTDGTKWLTFGHTTSGSGPGIQVASWNAQNSFASQLYSTAAELVMYEWLKCGVVSSDPKNYYVSRNGTDWIQIASVANFLSGFMTPTQIGLYGMYQSPGGVPPGPVAGTNILTNSILYYKDADIVPSV